MENGFNGFPLALFTGTAPSGTAAIVLISVLLLTRRVTDPAKLTLVKQLMAIPLAVAWFGFIASATHLGTPANALYAFSNVGSSPLSNEVAAAVAFLFVAGVYWLASFQPNCPKIIDTVGPAACIVSGIVLLACTSAAYNVATVPTWSIWHVSATMILAGVAGGLSLTMLVVSLADVASKRTKLVMIGCSAAAIVVCAGIYVGYEGFLQTVGNNVVEPGARAGAYAMAVPAYVAIAAMGLALQAATASLPMSGVRRVVFCGLGCLFVLVASVIVRVPFYDAYLPIGF